MNFYSYIFWASLVALLGMLLVPMLMPFNTTITDVGVETLEPYFKSRDELQMSSKIGERGVFATQDYSPGDLLEVCPAIRQIHSKLGGEILNYVFSFDDDTSLIGFGYCSMYNHSDKNNAEFTILNSQQIEIRAVKPIQRGEEIFISYGDEYWEGRDKKE